MSEDTFVSTIYKKSKIVSGISQAKIKKLGDTRGTSRDGIGGGQNEDANPALNVAVCEKHIGGSHNASIVFGKDRPGSRLSGFGGRGDTHCGMVDIVAGRMAHRARTVNRDGEQIFVDPNFTVDAARIYLSQKTNVDRNFRLAKGSMPYADIRSVVAIKADGVRVIAREGIKLVTGVDAVNSQGSEIANKIYGIDLIANNDDTELQPMVKGDNLVDAMQRIVHHLDRLGGIVDAFLHTQMTFNLAVQTHTHISPFFGIPVTVAPALQVVATTTHIDQFARVKVGLLNQKVNLALYRIRYLNPVGDRWINSFYNNTN